MKYPDNIRQLSDLAIDIMGFIFYPESPRYAGDLQPDSLKNIPARIKKAGVFVNEDKTKILEIAKTYDLQMLQLHGQESPELCKELRDAGYQIIKAFPVKTPEDFNRCSLYTSVCDYFLFDTKTYVYGGSGQKFDWNILAAYREKTPFFLSGGICVEDVKSFNLQIDTLFAIDLNSRFEITAGLKDIDLITTLFY